MDALDACTDMLPFHLLVEKLVYRVGAQLTSLPQIHPLGKHVDWAAKRYIKAH